jgi:hypothetical protein
MKEHAYDLAKATPPATVGGYTLMGIHLQEWVIVLTLFYTVICIVDKLFPSALPALRAWASRIIGGKNGESNR